MPVPVPVQVPVQVQVQVQVEVPVEVPSVDCEAASTKQAAARSAQGRPENGSAAPQAPPHCEGAEFHTATRCSPPSMLIHSPVM